jgi:polyphosphate kinase
VRLEVGEIPDPWMMRLLKIQWDLDESNIFHIPQDSMIDFTGLNQIIGHKDFKDKRFSTPPPLSLNFPVAAKCRLV